MSKRPNTRSEGAMIQRQYVNKMLQRVSPLAKDIGLRTPGERAAFRDGVEWLKAKLYEFIATEPKRTGKPGGIGRRKS